MAEEEDIIDSDFDEDEAPDDEVHDEDADRRSRKNVKKKNVFKDKIAEFTSAKSKRRIRKKVASTAAEDNEKEDQKLSDYVAPEVRGSTTRKINESIQSRRKMLDDEEYDDSQDTRSKKPKHIVRLTQTQLLNEAVQTELENTQSLSRLERLEEEKKTEIVVPKVPFSGKIIRYRSQIGMPNTITFLNTHEYPAIFNQRKPKKKIALRSDRTRYYTKEATSNPLANMPNELCSAESIKVADVAI